MDLRREPYFTIHTHILAPISGRGWDNWNTTFLDHAPMTMTYDLWPRPMNLLCFWHLPCSPLQPSSFYNSSAFHKKLGLQSRPLYFLGGVAHFVFQLRWKFGWHMNIAMSDQFVNFTIWIDNWQPFLACWWKKPKTVEYCVINGPLTETNILYNIAIGLTKYYMIAKRVTLWLTNLSCFRTLI